MSINEIENIEEIELKLLKKLLPCPFCDSEATILKHQPTAYWNASFKAICTKCQASSKEIEAKTNNKNDLRSAETLCFVLWNNRPLITPAIGVAKPNLKQLEKFSKSIFPVVMKNIE